MLPHSILGVKGSVCQGWVADCALATLQKGPNDSVVSTPLPIKLLSLASSSRHLDSNQKGGCVCDERTPWVSSTWLELQSLYMQRCRDWGPRCATHPRNIIDTL